VTVVGAPVAVLADGPAELRHRQHHHVAHPGAEIPVQRRETFREILETRGELAALVALPRVGVPASHVREGDLEADVGSDQLSDLPQALAEAPARVHRAVRRRDPLRGRRPEHLHRLEGLAAGAVEEIAHSLLVERLEALPRAGARRRHGHAVLDVEVGHAVHRHRAHVPAQDARQDRPQRDGPEGRGRFAGRHPGEPAREPAVGGALEAGRPRLHVVLRVEVGARGVGRAAGVHDREAPIVPDRLERRERGVQAEESGQVEGGVRHARSRAGDRDVAARGIVVRIAVRNDHAEAVHRAPLEDGDQDLRPGGGAPLREGRAREEARRAAQREQGERAALHERAPRAGVHGYLRWNSGEPRTSAASFSASVSFATRSYGVVRVISGLSS
jgi:hypothetical protein